MQLSERIWFDQAYECSRGTLPFGFFTGLLEDNELQRVIPRMTPSEVTYFSALNCFFLKDLPSTESFAEEKARILPSLRRDLQQRIPFISSVIHFGSLRGDIDLSCIGDSLDTHQLQLLEDPGKDLRTKYPLVDWHSLAYFRISRVAELPERLRYSRRETRGNEFLSTKEEQYIKETILEAQVLWGDASELERLKNSLSPSFL